MTSNPRLKLGVSFVLLAVGVASCVPPESQHPLSDPAQAKPDARLVGLWAGDFDGAGATIQFFPKTGPYLDLVLTGNDGEKGASVLVFDAFPSTVAGKTYLNLRAKTFEGSYADKITVASSFIFARYDVAKDGSITFFPMDDELVKTSVAAGKLKGSVKDGTVTLTASTKELAEYVRTADAEKLFKKLATFRKR
jgi:hypothetical protein